MAGPALGGAAGPLGGPGGAAVAPGAVRALACPSCGAPVPLRAMGWAHTVACASCAAVLDAAHPSLRVLQEAARRSGPEPLIPLGTRGAWRGAEYEAVGVREQEIDVDGVCYAWREYVLFNPYRGFRYLVEYDGHWTSVASLRALPDTYARRGRPVAHLAGVEYRHFQTATARTAHVLGEFPWEARVGDEVRARDFVAPPLVLTAEDDRGEITWSAGEYVPGSEVWRAFRLDGRAPAARGVYASQPNPHAGAPWELFAAAAMLLMAALIVRFATAADAVAYRATYEHVPGLSDAEAAARAFVTPTFALGRGANVRVETSADLNDQWMAVDYTLVDEATGAAYEAQRELGFYSGVDAADGSRWTEGSRRDQARIGPVPAGRYFLRVATAGGDGGRAPITWTLSVRRDVPSPLFFVLGLAALAVPPLLMAARRASFESRRWAESDYAPSSDDDDSEA